MAVVIVRNIARAWTRPIVIRAFDDAMIVDHVTEAGAERMWSWTSPVVLRWAGWE